MHILVVEDEERLARLVARVLTEERHVVDIANDGDNGLYLALRGTYDVIILDLMLPGEYNGLDICREVRAQHIPSAILMLTARGAVEDRVAGLRIGADDYLVKPFAMEELLARVDALLRRGRAINDVKQLQVGNLTLDLMRREATRDGKIIELTAKEFALLEYLMRHPGQVLTRTQIIDHVWQYDSESLSNVVDIYIHYLRDKIDRGFTHPMLKTMRGVGYKIEP
ncbi:MAG TPA: response regulator transcription factor [Ktedonobacterales bacterium]|nr:response regulator transcription factor [Ktedonobacterales bacterium]